MRFLIERQLLFKRFNFGPAVQQAMSTNKKGWKFLALPLTLNPVTIREKIRLAGRCRRLISWLTRVSTCSFKNVRTHFSLSFPSLFLARDKVLINWSKFHSQNSLALGENENRFFSIMCQQVGVDWSCGTKRPSCFSLWFMSDDSLGFACKTVQIYLMGHKIT